MQKAQCISYNLKFKPLLYQSANYHVRFYKSVTNQLEQCWQSFNISKTKPANQFQPQYKQ